ncbi:MAG: hypothetical protein J6K98_00140, partial [Clostridia bacterium]|nr:hypothetical protein [Clostridia bacterium]
VCCGNRLCAPYGFAITEALIAGDNRIVVEVVNNPAYRERDEFSRYLPYPPSGLLGPVRLGRR